jgi:hypothetical protein
MLPIVNTSMACFRCVPDTGACRAVGADIVCRRRRWRRNAAPGERAHDHPGYYAAYVLDPDGNNVEVVFHGVAQRSAASVRITF